MKTFPLWVQVTPGALMCAVLLTCAVLSCSGCATVAGNQEIAWQALNVVDAGQTATIARRPDQFMEVDPIARATIGTHPKERDVYLYMAATAVAHLGVSCALQSLDEHHPGAGWGTALSVWESGTLAVKGYYIGKNYRYGIKPWEGQSELNNSRSNQLP
jgi:hypothetical protein